MLKKAKTPLRSVICLSSWQTRPATPWLPGYHECWPPPAIGILCKAAPGPLYSPTRPCPHQQLEGRLPPSEPLSSSSSSSSLEHPNSPSPAPLLGDRWQLYCLPATVTALAAAPKVSCSQANFQACITAGSRCCSPGSCPRLCDARFGSACPEHCSVSIAQSGQRHQARRIRDEGRGSTHSKSNWTPLKWRPHGFSFHSRVLAGRNKITEANEKK